MINENIFRGSLVALAIIALATPSQALETYSSAQQQQFTDWCTGAKTYKESVCSCALKRLAQTVPPAALSTYLSSQGSFTLSTASAATAATVAEALVTCSN